MKNKAKNWIRSAIFGAFLFPLGCAQENTSTEKEGPAMASPTFTSFQEDVDFLRQHTDVVILKEPSAAGQIVVSGSLQGRVMTSSSSGTAGRSYGWINRPLFESGDTLEHMNAFGGEERFWLGPEGGQFSIFFKAGQTFDLDNWQTPPLIDITAFDLVSQSESKAVYTKTATLTNYSGFTFEFNINRAIEVLTIGECFSNLQLPRSENIRVVGYQTTNTLTNVGDQSWERETGLLSIWLLGMFNPSPATTIVIPFQPGTEESLGAIVNDTYFGKVPDERLKVGDRAIFFNGDGQYRSKIGLLPTRAKDILGAYDASTQTLTIVKYNKPDGVEAYVNSLWEIQDQPYQGDVLNSYNDGPPEPGAKALGPFYELESSSPALALAPGGSGLHIQWTYHFEGPESELTSIAKHLLGLSLEEIKAAL